MKIVNKKIILPIGTLLVASAPIALAVSCGGNNNETTAEENQRGEILLSGSDYILQQYLSIVNKNEYGKNNLAKYEADRKAAWNFWASSKLKDKDDYWYKETKNLLSTGVFEWSDFIDGKVWKDFKTDKIKTLKMGESEKILKSYPSWELAKEIIKKKPTLTWNLEIENLLMVQNYMTSFKKSEYEKVYSNKDDEPMNLDKKDPNFFLTQYLHSNTPILLWTQQVQGDKHIPLVNKKIKDVDGFNSLIRQSLIKTGLGKQGQLKTSNDNGLTLNIGDLYSYQGVSTNALDKPKGEIDNTEYALRKRLKDNLNESGFVNEDGNIEKEAHVIVETDSIKSIFGMQFFPWMEAYGKDGKRIKDPKKIGDIDEEKSFWRLDTKLTKDRDMLQKLIFTLVDNNAGLISEARKFMLNIRKYNLRTDNEDLEDILKGKGVIKK